ncbi:acetoacetate decarboxylase family protein [Parahaliea sp. F7430]|uniref:Acetoacetate decarboxylase family protein n=1 Tax=Sediminihaliea albiluteola TaxID=2758564 RepID=A0A7W2TWT8_9GAMM|nr:acetoacetate decarboxylase family protein [Sediminihaliea albiluteola]MBA6413368.1 acetoacetate decarboxylase family protein [Sediminihaliea albiluteola]
MSKLRYVRDPNKTLPPRKGLDCTVESLRVVYETDPAIHAALLPKPLQPHSRPEIFIQHANVSMHVSETKTVTIGAATVGVRCSFEGTEGCYVLAMPMEGEFVVISGRERFGEPKKIAEVATMERDGNNIKTTIGRHGINFLEMSGTVQAESVKPDPFTEYFFCHKALPRIDGQDGFDGPVFLTRLNWERNYTALHDVDNPQVILRESPFDPLIDVPVEKIVRMQFAVGATNTSGQILTEIPPEYLVDHIHQRYDDGLDIGIRLDGAGSKAAANG